MSIAFICFQLWVLVISFLAVVYESVPHLAAVMIAHFLGLVYGLFAPRFSLYAALTRFNPRAAIYQVTQTRFFHRRFHEEIINEACNSDIIPGFWEEVVRFQISIAVFEAVGFLAIAFLAWKLMSVRSRSQGFFFRATELILASKVLEWRTFKKLGADRRIARAHAVSLIFQLLLQLLAYFLIAFRAFVITPTWEELADSFRRRSLAPRALHLRVPGSMVLDLRRTLDGLSSLPRSPYGPRRSLARCRLRCREEGEAGTHGRVPRPQRLVDVSFPPSACPAD